MPRERPLKMDAYGISFDRYKELDHFCKQYGTKKAYAAGLLGSQTSSIRSVPGHSGGISDPVARAAEKRAEYLKDVDMIEKVAKEADAELYVWLLKAVTTHTSMRAINPPCGRDKFLAARRRFFYLLDKARK